MKIQIAGMQANMESKIPLDTGAIEAQLNEAKACERRFIGVPNLIGEFRKNKTMTWVLKKSTSAQHFKIVFGTYPEVTPAEAFEITREVTLAIQQGPAEESPERTERITFREFIVDTYFLETQSSFRIKGDVSLLLRWVIPELGAKRLKDIASADITSCLSAIRVAAGKDLADKCNAVISAVMRMALYYLDLVDLPDCVAPTSATSRESRGASRPTLSSDEVRAFNKAADSDHCVDAGMLFKFVLLTAISEREARALTFDNWNKSKKTLELPNKWGSVREVSLCPDGNAIVLSQHKKNHPGPLIFSRENGRAMGRQNAAFERIVEKAGIGPINMTVLQRTAAISQKGNVPPEQIFAALGHRNERGANRFLSESYAKTARAQQPDFRFRKRTR